MVEPPHAGPAPAITPPAPAATPARRSPRASRRRSCSRPAAPRARRVAIAVAIAGIGAALLLEALFWGETGEYVPHGWFAGPFAAWAAAAGVLRLRHVVPAGASSA